MKIQLLATLATAMLSAAPASALAYDWTFTPDTVGPGTLDPVSGTISGLHEGSNDGHGIVVRVTKSDLRSERRSDYQFDLTANGGDAFTVVADVVTFADAVYTLSRGDLGYGVVFSSGTGYNPELFIYHPSTGQNLDDVYASHGGVDVFTPSPVPEAASLAMMGVGVGVAGVVARRRRQLSGPS